MSKTNDYLGRDFNHAQLGKVKVIGKKDKSITVVIVEQTDRGVGFDETSQTYKGVIMRNGWMRGDNKDFGKQHEVHYKELK